MLLAKKTCNFTFMQPDYAHKLFNLHYDTYIGLMAALAADAAI